SGSELPDDGRFGVVPFELHFHFSIGKLGRPIAQEPGNIVQAMPVGPPFADEGGFPHAVLAHVKGAVLARRRQFRAKRYESAISFFQRRVTRRKANRLNVHFKMSTFELLEYAREGFLDGLSAHKNFSGTVIQILSLLGPRGGNGFCVALLKGGRKGLRHFVDGFRVCWPNGYSPFL